MRAVRGAVIAAENTEEAIRAATQDLLLELARRNHLRRDEVISLLFSVTQDLDSAFPARFAREIGWDAPALDVLHMHVSGAAERCIRILLFAHRDAEMEPAYIGEAAALRPDLSR